MPVLASFLCGLVFGCGLTISGMAQPTKVLGFLDFFGIPSGAWDPSLAVVMAAGLAVASGGYALLGRRAPLFEKQSLWPTKTDIDRPLLSGATLFGIGWGLVGLCPGPAIVNLSTLSLPVIVSGCSPTIFIGRSMREAFETRLAGSPPPMARMN
jgi:hypothetical protein